MVSFTACDKDDKKNDPKDNSSVIGDTGLETLIINGKIGDYVSDIDPDKVTKISVCRNYSDASSGRNAITEVTVTNKQFSLTLTTPPTDALISVESKFGGDGLSISNPSAKCFIACFSAFGMNQNTPIYKMNDVFKTEEEYEEEYWYVDSDVSITGTVDTEVYNLKLKKGWNVIGSQSSGSTETWKNAKMRSDLLWVNP